MLNIINFTGYFGFHLKYQFTFLASLYLISDWLTSKTQFSNYYFIQFLFYSSCKSDFQASRSYSAKTIVLIPFYQVFLIVSLLIFICHLSYFCSVASPSRSNQHRDQYCILYSFIGPKTSKRHNDMGMFTPHLFF